jgi:hypothetical protein
MTLLTSITRLAQVTASFALFWACAHTPPAPGDGAQISDARQAFEAAQRAHQAGSTQAANEAFKKLALQQPWSWWGRRALEELDRGFADLAPTAHEEALQALQVPGNTGQLLFYSARAQAATRPTRAVALCLLLPEADPGSAYRSQCEDLVLELLPQEDRKQYLAQLLVPGRRDDPATFFDGRKQRLELELATLEASAGNLARARQHLLNCVNLYEGAALKDDALWLLAQYSKKTEPALCRRAVRMLQEDYQHSRHIEAIRQMDCSSDR